MPPTLALGHAIVQPARPISSFLTSFLVPCLRQSQRSVSLLASLADNPDSYRASKRRGRGPSSGLGKTSGRGHKGQKAKGSVPKGFQGGQTPEEIVHGKRGFENVFSVVMTPLNLGRLQSWIDQGRIDPTKPITMKELVDSRCLHGVDDGVKVLGDEANLLTSRINLLVSRASASAIRAIEAAGGTVTTRYYTPTSIRRILREECDAGAATTSPTFPNPDITSSPTLTENGLLSSPFRYRLPDPTSRKDIEYYRDPAHRGYLSHLVPDGEGPSLFFKTPGTGMRESRKKASVEAGAGTAKSGDNRIW